MWIVNPENGKILVGMLCGAKASAKWLELEHKRFIDCKEFPFDQETKIGLMRFYHQKQFCNVYNISKKDLERLRAIDRNEPVIGDDEAAALWHNIDYGTGIGVENLTYETLVKLKTLADEFGERKLEVAIEAFCEEHYDELCMAVMGNRTDNLPLSCLYNTIKALSDILTSNLPKYSSATAPERIKSNLRATVRPFSNLCAPTDTHLCLYFTKEGVFFSLEQLNFANYMNLSEAFCSDSEELSDWSLNEALPYVDKCNKELLSKFQLRLGKFGKNVQSRLRNFLNLL